METLPNDIDKTNRAKLYPATTPIHYILQIQIKTQLN